ncbi:bis(5'-adenosyl)-triphosphatase ENPP4-like isoform X2 [Xenia sp. Carnegie-2017]|uniref:bis(5'-adenosyl)-triphosphatase ENPP4-like isoform X2 n=1 Tax=Xenia sp. Carnegie-2017 TaxID=2897299 RepID=UPI001F037D39|nr:bis(5'-adenosyl)-triphosphatase ENPP4-like isoform X2 [Xenia sp. Carnegie-2017]
MHGVLSKSFLVHHLLLISLIIICGHEDGREGGVDDDNKRKDIKRNGDSKNNVMLISLDSFGCKYLELLETPTLDSFKKEGVYADYVINVIPTETFPNHVSLATVMMHFDQLDEAGHAHGFGSQDTLREVKNIDNIIGYLLQELKNNNLLNKWNIILTADHGMTNISRSKIINITDYVDPSECFVNGDGGVRFVWPKEGKKEAVYKKLKSNHHPNMQIWRKEEFPIKFHYRNHRRVSPILITVDEGWTLVNDPKQFKFKHNGAHGYLNTYPSMLPIFFARGPGFRRAFHSKVFNLVDLYPIICKLLKIKPKPNNGTIEVTQHLLLDGNENEEFSGLLVGVMVTSVFFALGILICLVTMCLSDRKVKTVKKKNVWNDNNAMNPSEQSKKLLLDEESDEEIEYFQSDRL